MLLHNHLIVAHDVTNVGSDRAQLTAMRPEGPRGKRMRGGRAVLADRGYYNGDEVLACEGRAFYAVIRKTQPSGQRQARPIFVA